MNDSGKTQKIYTCRIFVKLLKQIVNQLLQIHLLDDKKTTPLVVTVLLFHCLLQEEHIKLKKLLYRVFFILKFSHGYF